ncbi:methyltransferase, cyclopropane fatty acid synthase [Thiorhodovibrio frisius]|uniref:Methyltransferase, cyclopropane fatty acid synthase n=2 Tax=Thiorhodovibrio frisius TaxID=631362 RepID=H8Z424_9GAMM|nr:methyltransferase, cyclopropane fatty acid synthase [Thiorhodovibrio frisius]WPL20823.1 Cyclopropane-fatty-acyl-phospholipid synthase [Thiorhodovibrio frisius]
MSGLYNMLVNRAVLLAERGWLPDALVRAGIRARLRDTLKDLPVTDCEAAITSERDFLAMMRASPIAAVPERANQQHYEVPAEFFDLVLGPRRKYSCCHWPDGVDSLAQAEDAALTLTAERAGIADGQRVLELGCGWGSFSLWAAAHYPGSEFVAVSNSHSQKAFIDAEAARASLTNLRVLTVDMNDFQAPGQFDRIVSIEMFEHMRNWFALFERLHGWLLPGGRFLMHIFCHRAHPYPYEEQGGDDWMTRFFFAGGIMPHDALPLQFQQHLRLLDHWRWDGRHYERTLNAWLARMDENRGQVMPILEQTYGGDPASENLPSENLPSKNPAPAAALWWMRWRLFLMACAELFGFRAGQEWWVGHYLFERPASESAPKG